MHCGCDLKLEVCLDPSLSVISMGVAVFPQRTFGLEAAKGGNDHSRPTMHWLPEWAVLSGPSGGVVLGECSDTAWSDTLIIRQMGWSRCGPRGDPGAACGGWRGQAADHPTSLLQAEMGG